MPIDLNASLDITKTPEEIIMEQINVENNTELLASDFLFSEPEVANLIHSEANTKIKLIPKATSFYYGTKDIYYKRMDISQIINNPNVDVIVTTETLLSDLIPTINSLFGINLTQDDYVEATLPVLDPANPDDPLIVAISIKPTSYLFYGTGNLVLGAKTRYTDEVGVSRDYYVITDADSDTVYSNKIRAFDNSYLPSQTFTALKNCFNVTKFRADDIIVLKNSDIYVRGEFGFDAAIGLTPLQTYDVTSIIMSGYGNIKLATNDVMFGDFALESFASHKDINKLYVVDKNNSIGINTNRLYCFNYDGTMDSAFSTPALTYVPDCIAVNANGSFYTASPEILGPLPTDPGVTQKHIRIDRFTSNGEIDLTFVPVTITSTGSASVTPVIQIKPITLIGAWVLLKPVNGVSTGGNTPIVNNTPFVPGATAIDGSFNPVFRINSDGSYYTQFKPLLLNNEPTTVFINDADTVVGTSLLNGLNNTVSYVTKHINPVTGYTHREPVTFDISGKQLIELSTLTVGNLRWDIVQSMVSLSNGGIILNGTARQRLPAGGWKNPLPTVAIYNKNSQLLRILYSPVTTGVPAVVSKLVVNEITG